MTRIVCARGRKAGINQYAMAMFVAYNYLLSGKEPIYLTGSLLKKQMWSVLKLLSSITRAAWLGRLVGSFQKLIRLNHLFLVTKNCLFSITWPCHYIHLNLIHVSHHDRAALKLRWSPLSFELLFFQKKMVIVVTVEAVLTSNKQTI